VKLWQNCHIALEASRIDEWPCCRDLDEQHWAVPEALQPDQRCPDA